MRLLAALPLVLIVLFMMSPAQAQANVTLVFPENGNISQVTTQHANYTFNCSANGSAQLANISLWINSTGIWSENQTQSVTGTWNFSLFSLDLGPGFYAWNCLAGDDPGNYTFAAENRTIQVINATDSDPPNITLVYPADGNQSTASACVNYTFNCSASDNMQLANISLWINSTGIWSENQTQSVTGTWNFSLFSLDLGPGYYIWGCQARDSSSNHNLSSQNRTIYVSSDATPPDLWFVPPTPGNQSSVSTSWIVVNVSASENLSWCGLDWNGTNVSMNVSGQSCFLNMTSLPSGIHSYSAYANDSSGNMNMTEERQVIVDTAYPMINITTPLNGTSYSTANLTINFTYMESNTHTCWYQYNGTNTTLENCTGSSFIALDHQQSAITVWMNDTAGNLNSSETVTFSVCTESWACSDWSACSGGAQARSCSDSYACGTTADRPSLSQFCSVNPSGGGGGSAPESADVSKTWASIFPGTAVSMSVSKAGLSFTGLSLEVTRPQSGVRITVAKLEGRPADVAAELSGRVYQYVSVSAENLNSSSLGESLIYFNVSKSWISSNKIDALKVYLNRYAGESWSRLQTVYAGEDSKNALYMARTPGFSYFAITGEGLIAVQANQTPEEECAGDLCEPKENITCTGNCTAEEAGTCRPGQMRCNENVLEVCSEAGDRWIALQPCSGGGYPGSMAAIQDWGWVIIVSAGSVAAGASVFLRRRAKDPFRI